MSTVTDRKFVIAWVDAYNRKQGVEAVASKLKIEKTSAHAKASKLRSQGVELPKMETVTRQFSVESLNNLIASRIK